MLFEKKSTADDVSQILSGIGSLMSGGQNNQGIDMSMVGTFLSALSSVSGGDGGGGNGGKKRSTRNTEHDEEQGIDWSNVINMGSMFLQQNNDMVMGLVPMVLEALGHGTDDDDAGGRDHSGHSWFLPPVLENIHVMWEHFRYRTSITSTTKLT